MKTDGGSTLLLLLGPLIAIQCMLPLAAAGGLHEHRNGVMIGKLGNSAMDTLRYASFMGHKRNWASGARFGKRSPSNEQGDWSSGARYGKRRQAEWWADAKRWWSPSGRWLSPGAKLQ